MFASRAWRSIRLTVPVALVTIVAAGCGGSDDPAPSTGGGQAQRPAPRATDPATARFDLTVGDLVPLNGELEPFGEPGRKAADLAVEEAEKALKEADVKGVKLRVQHADTGDDPETAVKAARRVVQDGATCIAGAWASTDTIPIAQSVTIPARVPLISPASTSAQLTTLVDEGYLFRTAPSNSLQAEALADVVEEELGGTDKTLAIGGRNDAYGQGLAQSFRRAWEAKGGQVTGGPVLYDPEQPDYKAEAERLTADDPDGYVIADFPDTFARVGAALAETSQFDAEKLFVTDGLAGESLPEDIPSDALDGARGTRPATLEEGDAAEAFDKLYVRSDRGPKGRQTFDAQNFDATMLCVLAAVAAGSGEGEAIQSKLREVSAPPGKKVTPDDLAEGIEALRKGQDIDYEGASGEIDFDGSGDPTMGTYEVFEFGRNRSFSVDRQEQAKQGQGVVDAGETGGSDSGADGSEER